MKNKPGNNLITAAIIAMADLCLLIFSAVISSFSSAEISVAKHVFSLLIWVGINFVIYITMYFVSGMHRTYWKLSSAYDYVKLVFITLFSSIIGFVAHITISESLSIKSVWHPVKFHLGVYLVDIIVSASLIVIFRVILRYLYKKYTFGRNNSSNNNVKKNAMIIGCGYTGNSIITNMFQSSNTLIKVVCIIDDDKTKIGQKVHNIPVVGSRNSIAENVKKYNVSIIIFAIPSCRAEEKAKILKICAETGCEVKTVPSVEQIISGEAGINETRKIEIEDLLGREPIRTDIRKKMSYVANRTVLVTGGGGSIGSELCRQIARYSPKELIIFDIYENSAYEISNELKRDYPSLNLITLIGSVRDSSRLDMILSKYKPDIIYHAAAHKHVPLMEDSPNEAIKNNVLGTYKLASAADRHGVKRFIMISTDKAVNPTNIMGATKRICEMIVQNFNSRSTCDFVAVRFGNVLGSNGSVIPLFKKQIEEGGPVTVTHPDIIRYFMTIPEAVSLVLEAGASANGGEIFVLDMGNPVKIVDLAKNLITLMGHVPDGDIKIEYTGLRPGEKLYEELLMAEEGLAKTENERIHIGRPIDIDEEKLLSTIASLEKVMYDDSADVRKLVHELVPTYKYD